MSDASVPSAVRPAVVLFDVNETLLDSGPLKERVGDLLQDPSAGNLWFATLLQYSLGGGPDGASARCKWPMPSCFPASVHL